MDDDKTSRVDYLRLVRRIVSARWRLVVGGLLLATLPAIAWIVVSTQTTYEATATLFLAPPRSEPGFLRDYATPEATSLYVAILRSRSLAQAVHDALPRETREELSRQRLLRDWVLDVTNRMRRLRGQEVIVYSPAEQAVRELQEARMRFNVARDGTVTLTATAFNPRVAGDLANTYVDVLLSRSSAVARQQGRNNRELLDGLLAQARASQADAEEALQRFRGAGLGISLTDEARRELDRLTQLETTLSEVHLGREIAQKKLAWLRGEQQKLEARPASAAPAPNAHRERVIQLEAKVATLGDRYTDRHPVLQSARAELQEAQERLRDSLQAQQAPKPGGETALTPLEASHLAKQMADLEVELVSLRARDESLQQRIARVRQAVTTIGAREQEYGALVRAAESQRRLVASLSDKLNAARISEQHQLRGIQVVDLASPPRQPSSRRPFRLLMMALVGGLAMGVGAAAFRERMAEIIETEGEVTAATGLPVLGSIPIAAPPRDRDPSEPRNLLAEDDGLFLPAEACRAIRSALDSQAVAQSFKTLLVTSPGVNEGKTTVLLSLGAAFFETGRRVLLVDGDLRRPRLHRTLGIPNEPGLADLLQGGVQSPEVFQELAPRLRVLPSGVPPMNPSSLVSSAAMADVVRYAGEQADVVLIDSPPVLAVSDSLPLTARVDGVVLVVRSGVTSLRSLVQAKQQLEKVGARVVGVVVNGLTPRDTRRYYSAYTAYAGVEGSPPRKKKGRRR
jgi:polysaccharide biosynthesis transport protein